MMMIMIKINSKRIIRMTFIYNSLQMIFLYICLLFVIIHQQYDRIDAYTYHHHQQHHHQHKTTMKPIPSSSSSSSPSSSSVLLYSSIGYDRIYENTDWSPIESWNHIGCHYNTNIKHRHLQVIESLLKAPSSNKDIKSIVSSLSSSDDDNDKNQLSDTRTTTTATSPISLPKSSSSSLSTVLSSVVPRRIISTFIPPRRPTFLTSTNNYSYSSNSIQQKQHGRSSRSSTTSDTKQCAMVGTASDDAYSNNGLQHPCIIKVIGVGGGGCNAIDRMLDTTTISNKSENSNTKNSINYWALNTDIQVIGRSKLRGANVIQIGTSVTRGLGAGGNPNIGRMAAEESRQDIRHMIDPCDLCFITAGMGGGTGSGAAPVVARIAKEMGCLTIGIVTKPFAFEGKRRMKQALDAMEELRKHVDTIIVVSNDRLLEIIPDDTPLDRAFCVADDILRQGVIGITDIIVQPGLINVDFADVRAIMSNAGTALMGIGVGSGENAAEDAALAAISSPLLDATIDNAKGVVFNISGGPKLTLNEVNKAAKMIYKFVAPDANVIFGALVDESLGDNISITVLAAGFDDDNDVNNNIISNEQIENVVNRPQQQQEPIDSVPKRERENITPSPSTTNNNDNNLPDFFRR